MPDPVLLKQADSITRVLIRDYRNRGFSLLGSKLTSEQAFAPDRGLPVIVAAARELFCIAHPEKAMDPLFPFDLAPVAPGDPNGGWLGFRLCLREPPADLSLGMIFMDSAVRRAAQLSPSPDVIDLDQVTPALATYMAFLESQPSPSPNQPQKQ